MKPLDPQQVSMSVARLLREFTNGDENGWDAERAWLEENHPTYMRRLRASIAKHGVIEPVRLCYRERRVIDGHHRIVAAADVGLTRIPVADAWGDDDWLLRTPDPRPIEVRP